MSAQTKPYIRRVGAYTLAEPLCAIKVLDLLIRLHMSGSDALSILQKMIVNFTTYHREWATGNLGNNQSDRAKYMIATSPCALVYVAASIHAILRASTSQEKSINGCDLCLLFMGIMTSVLDLFTPSDWNWIGHLNHSGIFGMLFTIHQQYAKLRVDNQLPDSFGELADTKNLAQALQLHTKSRSYKVEWAIKPLLPVFQQLVDFMQGSGGYAANANKRSSGVAKRASVSAADIMDMERMCWECVVFSSSSRPLVNYQYREAFERLVLCMDYARLGAVLEAMKTGSSILGMVSEAVSAAASSDPALAGSSGIVDHSNNQDQGNNNNLLTKDFDMDGTTGILTLKDSVKLSPDLAAEMNGWRIPLPMDMQGGLLFARLRDDQMVAYPQMCAPN